MQSLHVIVGNSEDFHAVAVAWALEQAGADVLLWDGLGMQDDAAMVHAPGQAPRLVLGGRRIGDIASLWFRRPVPYQPLQGVDPGSIKFVRNELKSAHGSLAATLRSKAALTIGDWHPVDAATKGLQLDAAVACGFRIPDTLITNDPMEVARFRAGQAAVLVKHFTPHFWSSESERRAWQCGPVVIDRNRRLDEAGIRVCAAIYQAVVDKVCDLRVTVIGRRIFAVSIVRHDGISPLDWRPASVHPGELVMEPHALDEGTQDSILQLMDRLDLRYGCIDLAIDRHGRMYFFEINTGGQFLFVDDHVPQLNLLGEMAGFLLAGALDYTPLPREVACLSAFEATERCAAMLAASGRFLQSHRMITRVESNAETA